MERLVTIEGTRFMRMMHCGMWQNATSVFSIRPEKTFSEFRMQVVMMLECPSCHKVAYGWYGIRHDEKMTPFVRIHPREYEQEWQARIDKNQLSDALSGRHRLFVSEYSRKVAQSADRIRYYLQGS